MAEQAALGAQAAATGLKEQAATTAPTEPTATTAPTEPSPTAPLAEPVARIDAAEPPQEGPASRPSTHDEGDTGSERRARRARWAIAASLTFTLAAAAGAALWPRTPGPRTPETIAEAATRPSAELTGVAIAATSAAVEPTGAPPTGAPSSPGTTARRAVLARTSRPGSEEPSAPLESGDAAERLVRVRLEQRMRSGAASTEELKQLGALCARKHDVACHERVRSLLAREGRDL